MDLDVVYLDEQNSGLVFLLIDMLPSLALSLVTERLNRRDIEISSKQVFDAKEFVTLMNMNLSKTKEEIGA